MNQLKMGRLVSVVALVAAAFTVACGVGSEDPTLMLTGTESEALVVEQADGGLTYYCPEKKALVCHVPPGNPANEHTICVGKGAVNAHLRNHPDYEGACGVVDGGTTVPGGDEDAGEEGDLDAGTAPEVDAGTPTPTCGDTGDACTGNGDCCSGSCVSNVCAVVVG